MKQVQKNWRAMSEEQKEYYKVQSWINRTDYDEKKKQFDEIKMTDPEANKLNVIEGI